MYFEAWALELYASFLHSLFVWVPQSTRAGCVQRYNHSQSTRYHVTIIAPPPNSLRASPERIPAGRDSGGRVVILNYSCCTVLLRIDIIVYHPKNKSSTLLTGRWRCHSDRCFPLGCPAVTLRSTFVEQLGTNPSSVDIDHNGMSLYHAGT